MQSDILRCSDKDILKLYQIVKKRDSKDAIDTLNYWYIYNKNSIEVGKFLSRELIKNSDYKKALDILEYLYIKYPNNYFIAYDYLKLLFHMSNHKEAISIISSMNISLKHNIDYYISLLLCDIYFDLKDYNSSISILYNLYQSKDKLNKEILFILENRIFINIVMNSIKNHEYNYNYILESYNTLYDKKRYITILTHALIALNFQPKNMRIYNIIANVVPYIRDDISTSTIRHGVIPLALLDLFGIRTSHISLNNNLIKKHFIFYEDDNRVFETEGLSHPKFTKQYFETEYSYNTISNANIYVDTNNFILFNEQNIAYFKESQNLTFIRNYNLIDKKRAEFEGKTLLFSGKGYIPNYFHWIIDVLPSLKLITEGPLNHKKFDNIVFPCKVDKSFQIETLNILGIPLNKIATFSGNAFFEDLTVISRYYRGLEGEKRIYKWAGDFIRDKLFEKCKPNHIDKKRRVLFSRKDAKNRFIENEEELFEYISQYGFEIVSIDNLSICEQVQLFKSAEFIISPHGATLTNLVFANEGTKVIEIFNPEYAPSMYWSLSNTLNLDYTPYFSHSWDELSKYRHIDPKWSRKNIVLDMNHFKIFFEQFQK